MGKGALSGLRAQSVDVEAGLRKAIVGWLLDSGGEPRKWSELDESALWDVLHVQCFLSERKAHEMAYEVLAVPGLFGKSFGRRYVSWLAWTDDGRPKTPRKTHPARLPRYREMIVANARAAHGSRGAA